MRELAELAEVARATLASWRSGQKRPGPDARAQLEARLGISAAAWDTPVGVAPAPADPETVAEEVRAAVAHGASRAELEALLAHVRRLRLGRQLLEADRARYIDLELKILTAIGRADETAPISESKLAASPAFKRLTGWMLEALAPFPEAARALMDRLGVELAQ